MGLGKAQEIFSRLVIEKKKTRLTDLKEFPRSVVEYLINQFCPGEDFDRELSIVRQKLATNVSMVTAAMNSAKLTFCFQTDSSSTF